ncbi:hypothetical protein GCM10027060_26540 [Nesterenkonia halophila]
MSEESENEPGDGSPFTKPGFIAAAVVLFIVVVMGGYLAWSYASGDEPAEDEEPEVSQVGEAAPTPSNEEKEEQTKQDSVCGLSGEASAGSRLARGPATGAWDYDGIMPYPVSEKYGPAAEEDGYRYCYQRTPEGALFFAANAVEQGESDHAEAWIDYAVSEGTYRDELVADVSGGRSEDIRMDIVGFRVLSFDPDSAVVHLAIDGQSQGQTVQLSAEFDLAWEDGDWKFNGDVEEPLSMVPVGGHGSQVVRWSQGD